MSFIRNEKNILRTQKQRQNYAEQRQMRAYKRVFNVGDLVETKDGSMYKVRKITPKGLILGGGESDFLYSGDLKRI